MLRLTYLILIAGSSGCWLPEDAEPPSTPPDVCGDGKVTGTEVCDDGNLVDGDGCSSSCGRVAAFQTHWQTSSLAGAVQACPVGFDLVDVIFQPVRAPDVLDGPELVHTVDCSDGVAETEVPPRLYDVSVRFSNRTTGELYGETLPERATTGQRVTMYTDAGFARVTWDLRSATGQALDCQAAVVDNVIATFTPAGGGAAIVTSFPCAAASGITPPLGAGVYDLELAARQQVTTLTGVTIDPRSALTDPGPIAITMPPGT